MKRVLLVLALCIATLTGGAAYAATVDGTICAVGTAAISTAGSCRNTLSSTGLSGFAYTAQHTVALGGYSTVGLCPYGTTVTCNTGPTCCKVSVASGKRLLTYVNGVTHIKITTSAASVIKSLTALDPNGTNVLNNIRGTTGTGVTHTNYGAAMSTGQTRILVGYSASWALSAATAIASVGMHIMGTTGDYVGTLTVELCQGDLSSCTTLFSQTMARIGTVGIFVSIPAYTVTNCAGGTYRGAQVSVSINNALSCSTCANWTYALPGKASCTACLDPGTGWTKASGTGWDSASDCVATYTAPTSACTSGAFKKKQVALAWGGG